MSQQKLPPRLVCHGAAADDPGAFEPVAHSSNNCSAGASPLIQINVICWMTRMCVCVCVCTLHLNVKLFGYEENVKTKDGFHEQTVNMKLAGTTGSTCEKRLEGK